MDKLRGRPPVWGNEADTMKATLPLEIVSEIDSIRSQISDPTRAKEYVVELLRRDARKMSLKLYDSRVSASPCVTSTFELGSENSYEIVEVPVKVLSKPNDSFLLKVAGDSMKDAGIDHGDIVAIKKFKGVPGNGDIVLARIDDGGHDQIVIKRYREYRFRYELQSMNKEKNYAPIQISRRREPVESKFLLEDQCRFEVLGIFDTVVPQSWIDL